MNWKNFELIVVAQTGDHDRIKALVTAGADINAFMAMDGGIPTSALIEAATRGHTDACRVLLKCGADANATDRNGDTALYAAATSKRAQVCQLLLTLGADPYVVNNNGLTAMHRIFLMKLPLMLTSLGDHDFNASYIPSSPPKGYLTPFQLAVKQGWPEVVEYMANELSDDVVWDTIGGSDIEAIASQRGAEMQRIIMSMTTARKIKLAVDGEEAAKASGQPAPKRSGMSPL